MKNITQISFLMIATLSACAGSSSDQTANGTRTFGSDVGNSFAGSTDGRVSINITNNTVQINDGDILQAVSPSTIPASPYFVTYANDDLSEIAIRASQNVEGAELLVYSDGSRRMIGSSAVRLGDFTQPASGSVQYTGDYRAIFRSNAPLEIASTIAGTATVNIDFSDERLSGVISNRIATQPDGETFDMANILLDPTTLDQGTFGETTTGGEFIQPNVTSIEESNYGGVVINETTSAVVGSVRLNHTDDSGFTGQEIGTFVAVED